MFASNRSVTIWRLRVYYFSNCTSSRIVPLHSAFHWCRSSGNCLLQFDSTGIIIHMSSNMCWLLLINRVIINFPDNPYEIRTVKINEDCSRFWRSKTSLEPLRMWKLTRKLKPKLTLVSTSHGDLISCKLESQLWIIHCTHFILRNKVRDKRVFQIML